MPEKQKEMPAEKAKEEYKFKAVYVVHSPTLDTRETYTVQSNKPLEGKGLEEALRDADCKVTSETGELKGMLRDVLADQIASGEVEVSEKKPYKEAFEKAAKGKPYAKAFKEATGEMSQKEATGKATGKMAPKEAEEETLAVTTQQYEDPTTGTKYLVQFHEDKVPSPSAMSDSQLMRPGNIARVYALKKGEAEGTEMPPSEFIKLVKGDERSGTSPKMLKRIKG